MAIDYDLGLNLRTAAYIHSLERLYYTYAAAGLVTFWIWHSVSVPCNVANRYIGDGKDKNVECTFGSTCADSFMSLLDFCNINIIWKRMPADIFYPLMF